MSGPAAVGLLLAGIALLGAGGEGLVRGSVSLARLARVSPAVIGLTLVAMGTSLPELGVSLLAALQNRPDFAMGNVVGSNILNIGVVTGLTALIMPVAVHSQAVRLEWPVMLATGFLAILVSRDGSVDRLEGAFLVLALALFMAYVVRVARTEVGLEEADKLREEVEALTVRARVRGALVDSGLILGGIGLLVVGAHVLVRGAVTLAELLGASERVIGLTVIAGGTSLPELATCVVAALRRRADLALANIIGSNIFNVLGILGTVAMARPVAVTREIVSSDMVWMIAFSLLLFPLMRTRMRVARAEGVLLLGGYLVYLAFLLR